MIGKTQSTNETMHYSHDSVRMTRSVVLVLIEIGTNMLLAVTVTF